MTQSPAVLLLMLSGMATTGEPFGMAQAAGANAIQGDCLAHDSGFRVEHP